MIQIEYFANRQNAEWEAYAAAVRNEASVEASPAYEAGGPILESLTSPEVEGYCVIKGTIPPGVTVPLHSHGDTESFHVLSGEAQLLIKTTAEVQWKTLRYGDFIHIPSDVKHAWRNVSSRNFETIIITTPKLGRCLRQMGELVKASPEQLQLISDSYGYWLGSPQQNAELGIAA